MCVCVCVCVCVCEYTLCFLDVNFKFILLKTYNLQILFNNISFILIEK